MYAHTQIGWMVIIALVAALIVIGAAGMELGPESPGRGAWMITLALLGLLIPLFGWLTVTMDNEKVTAKFGIGIIRKSIAIKVIQGATPVRNKWYYGWGIRMLDTGWMFNVSGLDAVEIELKSGGKFRIGTDEAQELASFIKVRCSTFAVRG